MSAPAKMTGFNRDAFRGRMTGQLETMPGRYLASSMSQPLSTMIFGRRRVGTVQSAFSGLVNCRIGEHVITVADAGLRNLPYGILCDFSGVDLRRRVAPCQEVVVDGNELRIEKAQFVVDVSDASIWSPFLHLRVAPTQVEGIRSRMAAVLKIARATTRGGGLTSLLGSIEQLTSGSPIDGTPLPTMERLGCEGISVLVRSVRQLDLEAAVLGAKELIGLGIGLTPSGDDVLLGFLAALIVTADDSRRRHLDRIARGIVQRAHGATTDVSANYLDAAAQGYLAERCSLLVRSIVDGPKDVPLQKATEQFLSYGHTSGAEIILGLLLGMALVLEHVEARRSI